MTFDSGWSTVSFIENEPRYGKTQKGMYDWFAELFETAKAE